MRHGFYFIALPTPGTWFLLFLRRVKKPLKRCSFCQTGPNESICIHAQWKDFDFVEHKQTLLY